MKRLIFGDIHGRTIWKKIIESEQPDQVIFLGDYVSTHEDITDKQQVENLEEILRYKEENMGSVILLRGNHDLEALGWDHCWPCTGQEVHGYFRNNYERFLKLTQWIYVPGVDSNDQEMMIFSHAGITRPWLDKVWKKAKMNSIQDIDQINDLGTFKTGVDYNFGFSEDDRFDIYGTGKAQPCTWVRPQTLLEWGIEGTHVVGHTTMNGKPRFETDTHTEGEESYSSRAVEGTISIWLCDCLGDGGYLIQENGKFEPKQYKEAANS